LDDVAVLRTTVRIISLKNGSKPEGCEEGPEKEQKGEREGKKRTGKKKEGGSRTNMQMSSKITVVLQNRR
jgi:hypothetical protein